VGGGSTSISSRFSCLLGELSDTVTFQIVGRKSGRLVPTAVSVSEALIDFVETSNRVRISGVGILTYISFVSNAQQVPRDELVLDQLI
jgi:hypothetical protein